MHSSPGNLVLLDQAETTPPFSVQADSNAGLIALWLHGRPTTTRTAYEKECAAFLAYIGLPLRSILLRHAHVSHALDRGEPSHLVQQTVGRVSHATSSGYAHARPGDSSARYLGL